MADQWGRVIAGSAALAVIWIAVYWAWEPSSPPITYGSSPAPASGADPQPRPVDTGGPEVVAPPAKPVTKPSELPKPPEAAKAAEGPKAVAPEYTTYRVRAGDTLKSISTKVYGTDKHFLAIAKANPFKDPQRLKAGEEIRIPRDPTNIQGRDTIPRASNPPAAPGKPEPGAKAGTQEYLVQSGDTLSGISKKFYGTSKYTDLIYEANRGELASPDDVRVGRKLVIPPRPAEKPAEKTASGGDGPR